MMFEWSMAVRPASRKRATLLSLLRLLSISILCAPFRHVYPFQSMHAPSRINRFSGFVSPRKQTSSTPTTVTSSKEKWQKMFDLLCEYKNREGHVNVLLTHIEDGEKLGQWLKHQFENVRYGAISAEKRDKLESMGVRFDRPPMSMADMKWERMFGLFCAYKERENKTYVPNKYITDGSDLGMWMTNQRRYYKQGTLKEWRKNKLESVGVELDGESARAKREEAQWERMFDHLCRYKDEKGNTNVPDGYEVDGKNLGRWVANQRASVRYGTIDEQRIEKLMSVGLDCALKTSPKPLNRRWESMFDLLCIFREREGHTNVPYNHQEEGENLGSWLRYQLRSYNMWTLDAARESKLKSIGVRFSGHEVRAAELEIQWEEWFDLLRICKERDGCANIPQDHEENGKQLGVWLNDQRQNYKIGLLPEERQRKLESLGVHWNVMNEIKAAQWEKWIGLLRIYQKRVGHTDVPQLHDENGQYLGRWLKSQRRLFRAGVLKKERKDELESLGVNLTISASELREGKWDEKFNLLCRYKEREGHVNVPQTHKEEGMWSTVSLGYWLASQHSQWRAGTLKEERIEKLESLGVKRRISASDLSDAKWDKKFDLLSKYKAREGHVDVLYAHMEEGQRLGDWLYRQKASFKAGELPPERQSKLESLEVDWQVRTVSRPSWDKMFDLLCTYNEREGHANVPLRHKEEGQNLGNWLYTQCKVYNAGKLLPERQSKLESLGVQLKVRSLSDQWEEMFDLLCRYNEREGHANVPSRHKEEGQNLGAWLYTQCKVYNAGKLLPERQSKLESLGIQWDGNHAGRWQRMFDLLCRFKEREGHADVPPRHKEEEQNLGQWLYRQKRSYEAGTLQSARQSKLESLGVRW